TYAANEVGSIYPSLDGDKFTAAQKVRSAMNSTQSMSHTGAPIAFLITIVLFWLRPKVLRSLGR
ncbi:MAG: hypothetical protein ACREO3_06120, partial [Arenimonas sp.]